MANECVMKKFLGERLECCHPLSQSLIISVSKQATT
jgi:hypothetical protein